MSAVDQSKSKSLREGRLAELFQDVSEMLHRELKPYQGRITGVEEGRVDLDTFLDSKGAHFVLALEDKTDEKGRRMVALWASHPYAGHFHLTRCTEERPAPSRLACIASVWLRTNNYGEFYLGHEDKTFLVDEIREAAAKIYRRA
ncbi:MAG: hypothetical protein ISN29_09270 [Gammaproteobacteria bacterium AqS3]|nr:hypothetical protein [Gammaproteobacteria bacterium AqS3]